MTGLVPDPAGSPPQTVKIVNVANGLTMLRMALVPVFAVTLLYADGDDAAARVLAWTIFAVAVVTDHFDGQIARKRGLITNFGKLADPIADKALTGTALVGLSVLGELPWWVTVVILGRELGVTALRFWVLRHGVLPASRGGKIKTFTQALAIGLYLLPLSELVLGRASGPIAVDLLRWGALAVALVLTVATGLDYVLRAARLRAAAVAALNPAPDGRV